jgi:DNA-binding transcriptional LysR family regulator
VANRLEALRVFCTAAAAANFREAAARLSVSPQVVTRAVRELEEELGEPLFHRSTRGVQLTDFGRQLAERARVAVGGVDELFHQIDRRTLSRHAGTVRVTAPHMYARLIPQALAPLLAAHPGLVLDLRLSEQHADVVDEQIDIGIRVGPMRDARFVARTVGKMPLHVVAAPALIERVGTPQDLLNATTFCFCSPSFSMPSVMTSPTSRNFGGFMPRPTPGGVPVVMMSPGISVIMPDRYDTICGTLKIMVAVEPVWQRLPLTSRYMLSLCTSPTSSDVTSHGPSGPKVSCDLPLVHWPPRSIWKKRSETSLQTL